MRTVITFCVRCERLVLAADHLHHLLVARGDVALGGDIDKQRRKHQFQRVLVAPVDGVGPVVFDLLKLRDLRADGGGDARLGRGRGGRPRRDEGVWAAAIPHASRTAKMQAR